VKRALLMLLLAAGPAGASGLADHGEDLFKREETTVKLSGFFRVRGDVLHNLDLDRGPTPSGRPLFPVRLGDPAGQDLVVADMRLRTDVAIYAPFAAAAVKVRLDVIDDLVLGSTPVLSPGSGTAPTPAASPGQLPHSLFRLKRAYGEVLTPIGYLAAGRMGNMWGLGMYANGGDCLDCNLSDQADRVAFVTPVLGHLWAFAYDFSAVGPTALRRDGERSYVLDPSTNVSSVTFALMNVKNQDARDRRRKAGRWTVEYGAYLSYRWQANDVPQSYLTLERPAGLTPSSVMARGFRAGVGDGWVRLQTPRFRVELEGAVALAEVAQASLLPGVLLRDPVRSFQAGAALETQVGTDEDRVTGGLNAGFASGDPAPGFGAFPPAGSSATPGEFDAPQANVPRDTRVDNFRFNPNYRIDRILFAEIVGTVTDAVYVRPWGRATLWSFTSSQLRLGADGTFTRAVFASSTPGNDASLGLELHAALSWDSKDGFDVLAEYAVLFPFAGFNNRALGLAAQPAQLARLRLAWRF
jgi:uncharacterized protein (TIGR04551 family)